MGKPYIPFQKKIFDIGFQLVNGVVEFVIRELPALWMRWVREEKEGDEHRQEMEIVYDSRSKEYIIKTCFYYIEITRFYRS